MKSPSAVLAMALSMLTVMSANAANDIAQNYLKERVKIVARDTKTIPGYAITTYRKGVESYVRTNVIKRVNRAAPRACRYSKLKLIQAAKSAGKWEELKSAIKAMNMEDEWLACQYITSDYPAYVAATNAVIAQGIATEAEVQAFMKQAED